MGIKLTIWHERIAFFLAGIPIAVLSIFIQQHIVNLPWGEAWGVAGRLIIPAYDGNLELSQLFAQIADHRPVVSLALIVLVSPLFRWNMKVYAVVLIVQTLTLLTFVILLLQRQNKQVVTLVIVPLSLIGFALSLSAFWFRIYVDQLLPPLCLTASLLILSTQPAGWRSFFAVAVLSLVSLFSTLVGVTVWFVIPLAFWVYGYRRVKYYVLWVLLLIASLALYFQGWERSELTRFVSLDSVQAIMLIAQGALNVLGSTFANHTVAANLIAIGGIALTIFNIAILRKRSDILILIAPWVLIIIYALLGAGAISAGRVGQGPDYIFTKSHYILMGNMFWIGVIVLGVLACINTASRRWHIWLINVAMALVCAVSYVQINIQAASTFQPMGMEPYGPSREDELCVRAYVINGNQDCYKWGYWLGKPGHPIRTYDLAARRLTTFASLDNIQAAMPPAYQLGDLIVVDAPLAAQHIPLVDSAGESIPDTMIFRIFDADQRELYYLPLPFFAVGSDPSSDLLFREFIKKADRIWYLVAFTRTETGYWYNSLLQREYEVIDVSLNTEEKRRLTYPEFTLYSSR